MNGEQIYKVLKSDPQTRKHFQGVFPRDVFLRMDITPLSSTSFYICNLDEKDLPGSHWVGIEINHNDARVLYFDSYGLPPTFEDLLLKLSSLGYEIIWNDKTLQGFDSTVCGQYCILFCLLRSRSTPYEEVINTLQHNVSFTTHDRDHAIYHFLRSNFPIALSNLDTNIHNTTPFYR